MKRIAGVVILGAVGAVCVGGLSTAVEVGVKKIYPNGLILGSIKQQKNIMKSDLIIGSTLLIIGIALILFCKPPLPQIATKWWKSSLATLSYNGFISVLLLLEKSCVRSRKSPLQQEKNGLRKLCYFKKNALRKSEGVFVMNRKVSIR